MSFYFKDNDKLIYLFGNESLQIEAWGRDSVRVRAIKYGEFPAENWALSEHEATSPQISINGKESAEFINGNIRLTINHAGTISVYNRDKLVIKEYSRGRANTDYTHNTMRISPREFKPIIGGDYKIKVRFESLDENEKIFGMGQYQQPFLNLKGTDLELAQRNAQVSIPFMVSSLGYGFLWNSPSIGRVCFGKNMTTWESYSSRCVDYWITVGDTPAEIIERYAKATGYAPMMPDYAMGFWQSKLRYQTPDEVLSVAREYKKRGLPLSVIVIDYFHWPYQGDWRFDEEYWPEPEKLVKELNDMGIEVVVSVWPQVDRRSENYNEMVEEGLLAQTEYGLNVTLRCNGYTVAYDTTNRRARDYVWSKIKKNYYDKGFKAYWLDVAEPEQSVYDFENIRYSLGSDLAVGNIYPRMYAQNFYEGLKAEGDENPVLLIRSAWAGSQKYGALLWSGDIHSSFETLRIQIAAGLNVGMSGIPWWNTDIGGFECGNPNEDYFRELLVRWFQYGTFCPVMRLHGSRLPMKDPMGTDRGGVCASGADNEVWSFGDEAYEITKKYLFIRENLRPYIKEQMREAHEKGTPVMRTLFYCYPDDKTAWNISDEYMFGGDILVAPIAYLGAKERSVYLPAGDRWVDAWTKKVFDGGQFISADAPLDIIPLFVRGGRKELADLITE